MLAKTSNFRHYEMENCFMRMGPFHENALKIAISVQVGSSPNSQKSIMVPLTQMSQFMKASHEGNYKIIAVSNANVVANNSKINENTEKSSMRTETSPPEPARRGRPRRNS